MAKIVNLRQIRKQRGRDDRRSEADANSARFGEARPLRKARDAEADRSRRALDAHRREREPGDD